MASSALGTTVVDVTDDFFAPASMMLNPEPAIYCPERFVGKRSYNVSIFFSFANLSFLIQTPVHGWMVGNPSVTIPLMIGNIKEKKKIAYKSTYIYIYRCIVKLGFAGSFEGFDIDTSFFTGNQAPAGSVEGAYCPEGDVQAKDVQWTEILPKVVLPPNCQNIFALEKTTAVYTHLRLNNYPDGGIARFRAYGEVHPTLPKDIK